MNAAAIPVIIVPRRLFGALTLERRTALAIESINDLIAHADTLQFDNCRCELCLRWDKIYSIALSVYAPKRQAPGPL